MDNDLLHCTTNVKGFFVHRTITRTLKPEKVHRAWEATAAM
jgi:hypothetical protein